MAESDIAIVGGSAPTEAETPGFGQVAAGASGGLDGAPTRMVYVTRSLVSSPVVRAIRCTQAGVAPTAKGAKFSAAMRRGSEGSSAAFVFVALESDDVDANAYKFGLGPSGLLTLAKGALDAGIPDEAPGGPGGVLWRSAIATPVGAWVHVQVEAVVNEAPPTWEAVRGDTVVNAYSAPELSTLPTWERLAQVVDDVAGIRTGSAPLGPGFIGWACRLAEAGAWAASTAYRATRQT